MADFILLLPILLLSVVAHEFAHAWVAYREGDPTAFNRGRLTLNPIPHLDPVMSVIVPVLLWKVSGGTFAFGAARPVPVSPENFRHRRRGEILVASAGIAMNVAIAVVCGAAFVGAGLLAGAVTPISETLSVFQAMLMIGIRLNVFLAFFNLLPVPPLDGSHLLALALPGRWQLRYQRVGPIGFLALMVAMFWIPGVGDRLMWPVGYLEQVAHSAIAGFAIP